MSRKSDAYTQAALEKVFTEGEVTVEATLVTKSGKKIPHIYSAVRTTMGDKPVRVKSLSPAPFIMEALETKDR